MRSSLLPYAFVWAPYICMGRYWEFQMTSYEASEPMLLKSHVEPPWGEWKIAKMVTVHRPRWPPCPYMDKTFQNLLLQNRGCIGAESLHKSAGTGGLQKLLKWWLYIDWTFYGEVKFASVCICMGPIHLYGKMVIISNDLSSEGFGPMLLKFHVGQGNERLLKCKMVMVHWLRWLPCPYLVKTFKNLLLQNQISPRA